MLTILFVIIILCALMYVIYKYIPAPFSIFINVMLAIILIVYVLRALGLWNLFNSPKLILLGSHILSTL